VLALASIQQRHALVEWLGRAPGAPLVFGLSFPLAAPWLASFLGHGLPNRGKTAAPRCTPAFPRRQKGRPAPHIAPPPRASPAQGRPSRQAIHLIPFLLPTFVLSKNKK